MTEMPSPYDLLQDGRIEGLEELVHPYYQPPSEVEHSFPVVGQGITSQQFQQMSLAQGSGVLVTDDGENTYLLTGMPGGDSETNATNQMILKVAQPTGRSEAIIQGFYHVLYEDMTINLPPVTTETTYLIALTYDPRREEEPTGPIRVEVHTNELPRTHGRKHIVLNTVIRRPNQLLSDAQIIRYRHYVAPAIRVIHEDALPEPTDVNYGTIGFIRSQASGGNVVAGTGQIFESRGIHGWHNLLVGEWVNLLTYGGWNYENCMVRHRSGGIDITGHFTKDSGSSANQSRLARLPEGFEPGRTVRGILAHWSRPPYIVPLTIDTNGDIRVYQQEIEGGWVAINCFIPDHYYA